MSGDATFSKTVILLTRNGMGSGETELQHDLFAKYLRLLIESGSLPASMCFYTDGVRLVVEGSPFLERLAQIQEQGVRLVVCATCLNYHGLLDDVRVGSVGSMADILEAQIKADKVITL